MRVFPVPGMARRNRYCAGARGGGWGLESSGRLTLVLLVGRDLLGNGLHLQQQLDALDGRDSRLRDGCRHSASDEILDEGHGVRERRVHLAVF